MQIITLQLSKDEKDLIDKSAAQMGFRSRSEYIRQAVMKQVKKDTENDTTKNQRGRQSYQRGNCYTIF